jgi:hypothetical protein
MLHKHICFQCHRAYEEGEAGECQWLHDHLWGKCLQCEDVFVAIKPEILV